MVRLFEDTNIKAIADAIRAKLGTTDTYKTSEMASAIGALNVVEEKTTVTVKVLGKYNSSYSYCGVSGGDKIAPESGSTYDSTLELEKTDKINVFASATLSANNAHANITLNGAVVSSGSVNYELDLTNYSEVTIVFSSQYNAKWYTCSIVAK